jgi:hypothetical protein
VKIEVNSQIDMIESKKYPLRLSEDLKSVLRSCRAQRKSSSDILEEIVDGAICFHVIDKDKDSPFYFKILSCELINGQSYFLIEKAPVSESNNNGGQIKSPFDSVASIYTDWINLIRKFEAITFTENDEFIKRYEHEFYTDFKIVDDDADTAPYDLPLQLQIYTLLENVEQYLENQPEEPVIKELIQETKQLKEDIPNLTKNALAKKVAKILAKARKHGIGLLKKVIEEGTKEIIKRGIGMGIEHSSDITRHLSDIFHNLT